MKVTNYWEMDGITFYQIEDHGFGAPLAGRPLFGYGTGELDSRGRPKMGELYAALDRAMVAWVAEKYTGPRGAGGTGVGTAADWFMRMIGADHKHDDLTDAEAQDALRSAISDAAAESMGREVPPPDTIKARWMRKHLEELGLSLVRWRAPK